MNELEEIFKAWSIPFEPNWVQFKLASGRIQICEKCEFKEIEPRIQCSLCKCALRGRVFAPIKNACPKNKWEEIDNKFLE